MKNKIIPIFTLVSLLLAVGSVSAATAFNTNWQGSGWATFTITAPHVESTIQTIGNGVDGSWGFNGYQNVNIVDVTETQIARMSQFQGGGFVSATDRLTDSDMDNAQLNTYAGSLDGSGQVQIKDLGWSGTALYASFNDDRYGLPWPQVPTYGQSRGLGEHVFASATGSAPASAFASVGLGNDDRGVYASATGSSASVDGRASFGYNWANVESPFTISSLTISSS